NATTRTTNQTVALTAGQKSPWAPAAWRRPASRATRYLRLFGPGGHRRWAPTTTRARAGLQLRFTATLAGTYEIRARLLW
ncbi:serine protease, partial [Pyxidicoccus sp. 3LFB2]